MADRVHPSAAADPPPEPPPSRPHPQPGTYVIQVPKDQIYRIPPPENAHLSKRYSRRAALRRRGSCCRLISYLLAALLALLLALAAAAGVLYLVFRPKLPSYSIDALSISGFALSAGGGGGPALSPEFDVTVRAANPNKKIGIFYRRNSAVTVSYDGSALCNGVWPAFYQGARNVTVFTAPLKGDGIRLSAAVQSALVAAQSKGRVPLEIDTRVPVRVKFGAVTTWTITVKVHCEVTVDKLTAGSRIVSRKCRVKVKI